VIRRLKLYTSNVNSSFSNTEWVVVLGLLHRFCCTISANMNASAQHDENQSPSQSPRFSDVSRASTKASPLAHLRSVTPANIGRRRLQMASLLSSPARRTHQQRMSSIFKAAATSLSDTKLNLSPRVKVREDDITSNIDMNAVNSPERLEAVNYPTLPRSLSPSLPLIANFDRSIPDCTPRNHKNPFCSPKNSEDVAGPYSIETIKAQPFLQRLGRPKAPNFKRMDSIVPMDNTDSSSSSTLSASWTGDSQFFIQQTRDVPTNERQFSVSEWLDHLPTTPEEHSEVDDEHIYPLSPSVEVERGSMRRRCREWEKSESCASFDDDDIFSTLLR
jgi:hypothetical protein